MTARTAYLYFESRARVYRFVWRGSVISSFLNPIMFLAAMGLGLGTLVDSGPGGAAIPAVSYIEYLAPGLMAATAMQAATGDSAWPVMAGIKWLKTYDATLSTPLGVGDIVVGHIGFVTARMAFVTVVYAIIATFFDAMTIGPGLVAAAAATFTGMAFAAPVMAFTAHLDRDTGLVNLFRFGIVPMFLFSGTFFPITQLPEWIQPVAYVTPLWHGVELTRAAALQISPFWSPWVHIAVLGTYIGVGTVMAVRKLGDRLIT